MMWQGLREGTNGNIVHYIIPGLALSLSCVCSVAANFLYIDITHLQSLHWRVISNNFILPYLSVKVIWLHITSQ